MAVTIDQPDTSTLKPARCPYPGGWAAEQDYIVEAGSEPVTLSGVKFNSQEQGRPSLLQLWSLGMELIQNQTAAPQIEFVLWRMCGQASEPVDDTVYTWKPGNPAARGLVIQVSGVPFEAFALSVRIASGAVQLKWRLNYVAHVRDSANIQTVLGRNTK